MSDAIPHKFDLNIPIVLTGTQLDSSDNTVHLSFALYGFSAIGRCDPTVTITLSQDAMRRVDPRAVVMHVRQQILRVLADAMQLRHEAPTPTEETDD